MKFEDFQKTVKTTRPPAGSSPYLQSLWYDSKGDWNSAHEIIQDIEDSNAAWIHAYLHRKEGDIGNADYWYRKAGRTRPATTLDEEWAEIARALLG